MAGCDWKSVSGTLAATSTGAAGGEEWLQGGVGSGGVSAHPE